MFGVRTEATWNLFAFVIRYIRNVSYGKLNAARLNNHVILHYLEFTPKINLNVRKDRNGSIVISCT